MVDHFSRKSINSEETMLPRNFISHKCQLVKNKNSGLLCLAFDNKHFLLRSRSMKIKKGNFLMIYDLQTNDFIYSTYIDTTGIYNPFIRYENNKVDISLGVDGYVTFESSQLMHKILNKNQNIVEYIYYLLPIEMVFTMIDSQIQDNDKLIKMEKTINDLQQCVNKLTNIVNNNLTNVKSFNSE